MSQGNKSFSSYTNHSPYTYGMKGKGQGGGNKAYSSSGCSCGKKVTKPKK